MELIIIKCGSDYIRFKDDAYLKVKLDKASVFPMDKLELTREHERNLISQGFVDVSLKKLVLTEEELV